MSNSLALPIVKSTLSVLSLMCAFNKIWSRSTSERLRKAEFRYSNTVTLKFTRLLEGVKSQIDKQYWKINKPLLLV